MKTITNKLLGRKQNIILEAAKSEIDNVKRIFVNFSPKQFGIILTSLTFVAIYQLFVSLEFSSLLIASTLIGFSTFTIIRQKYLKFNTGTNASIASIKEDIQSPDASNNNFEAMLEFNPDSQLILNANKQAESLFAYSLEELRKLGPLEISPHSQPSGIASSHLVKENINEALLGKEPIFEWTHENKYGEAILCKVHLFQIASNGHKILRANIRDLREQKQFEDRIFQKNRDEIQRIDELAGLAIASASISSSLDIEEILEVVSKQLAQLLAVQICIISYWDDINKDFDPKFTFINTREGTSNQEIKVGSALPEIDIAKTIAGQGSIQFHKNSTLDEAYQRALNFSGASSILLIPLIAKSKTIGLIELQDTRARENFDERDMYLAQTLAQQAANAIENARLFRSTNRQLQELQSLKELAIASSEAISEEQLIELGSKIISERLLCDEFLILMRSRNQGWQKVYHEQNSPLSPKLNRVDEGIAKEVAKSGKPIRVGNLQSNSKYMEHDSISISELCVPIKIGGNVIGVLSAESNAFNHFSIEDEHLLITFANQMASGIGRLRNEAAQKRKGKQLRILHELSSQLAGILDKSRLFNTLAKQLHEKMEFLGVYIFSINEEKATAQLEANGGLFLPAANGMKYEQSITEGLLGKAWRENEIVVSNDVKQDLDFMEVEGLEKVESEAVLPIRVHKKNRYLLAISSDQINYFGEDEISALKTLVDHLSVSLESISLFDATRRQLQELTVVHSISNAAVNAKNENGLLERATEVIGATLYPDKFGFILLSDNRANLQIHPSYRGLDKDLKNNTLSANKGIVGKVATSGIPLRVINLSHSTDLVAVNSDIQSVLAVPLYSSQKVIGVINAESADVDSFSEGDLRLLSTIAGQIGTAIEKLRLFEAEKMQRGQAETLQEVAAILSGAADISKVADLILEELNRVVPFESASIQIIDGEDLVISAVGGQLPKNSVGFRLPILENKFARPMLEDHRTVFYEDISLHPGWLVAPGTEKIKSWIGAPLIARGKCIGILTVDGYEINQFNHEDAQLVTSFAIHAGIAIENSRMFKEIEESYSQTVSALANAIDVRDSYINGHSQRLANFAIEIGRILQCDESAIEDIYWGALLHDIGKIGVPDEILNKPSKLTEEEFEVIKQHPAIGERIIEPIKKLAHLGPIIRAHQEKHDGSGYPDKLKGNEIPLASRIIAVADAFVAMTDDRVYRKAVSVEKALNEIKRSSGIQFDPEVVDAFMIAIKDYDFN